MSVEGLDELPDELVAMISNDIAPHAEITPATELLLSGLIDSIGVIRIVDWLEGHLATEIDPVDVVLENFRTVDAIVEFLRTR